MPALSFPAETLLRAQGRGLGVKLAIFDVDGVLTDGSIFLDDNAVETKRFSVRDGQGRSTVFTRSPHAAQSRPIRLARLHSSGLLRAVGHSA